ncbi:hypothetical protein SCLCIDRAFT_1212330 [Scleroderma citrinum Foug A]|uniref:CHRD domain-containing protein n=1 Tax=Scleroderma citrinum Foug A TaxID=1036808 RepID=A0A0C3EA35_9AGAM|nr:hypothetical protein SCLCIDRAFT_1212330 [Scleroderma citrinum Foug A]
MRILVSLIVLLSGLTALVAAVAVPEPTLVVRQGKGKGKGENSSSTSSSASETSVATTATDTVSGAAQTTTSTTDTALTATETNSAAPASSTAATGGGGDAQTSLTLDPAVIAKGFASNGQGGQGSEAGQVASLTSTNNFINFCLTVPNTPITNGQQITSGSCNPAPMGVIPSTSNIPSAKFVSPANLDTVPPNTVINIQLAIQGMQTGFFVNPDTNYFAAPQQLNGQGQIQGHSHVVIEQLDSLSSRTPLNPTKFAFFKGLNEAAQNGILSTTVQGGLPAGVYRMASINTASNHQPLLVPVAQHGSLDDAVYFTVANNASGNASSGGNTGGNGGNGGNGGQGQGKRRLYHAGTGLGLQ